jgi:hypothetical protein
MNKRKYKKMTKRKITSISGKILVASVSVISFAGNVFAQDSSTQGSTTTVRIPNSFNVTKYLKAEGQNMSYIGEGKSPVGGFIVRGVNFLSLMIGSFAFLAIIIGALFLLTSGGDQNRTTRGKDIIKFAIIGLVVSLLAYFITSFTQSIFYEYGTATTSQ